VEYAGPGQSLEAYASASTNAIVCKSMSKVYALSGVRAAYLCGPRQMMEELRPQCPPWSVSLPGQIAACEALQNIPYYRSRWAETHRLREALSAMLRRVGWDVVPGCANFLLCHLPVTQPEAAALVAACRKHRLFIRDVSNMGTGFDTRTLRVAVKDGATNATMVDLLKIVLADIARTTGTTAAA